MPRRQVKKPKQPPYILLDHNVQAAVAERLAGVARFRQIDERQRESRFQKDAEDRVIFMGPRRFLFVTHDQDFLNHDKLPHDHGGVLVFVCAPAKLANALKNFLDYWGPRRNLLRGRIFRLSKLCSAANARSSPVFPSQYSFPAAELTTHAVNRTFWLIRETTQNTCSISSVFVLYY